MQQVQYLSVSIDDLRKNTWNTNKVSPDNEVKIRKSLERNGMFKPVIVRTVPGVPGYEIIGGEHRWEQAVELGYDEIQVANLGDITELQAKEIGVVDNARYGLDDTLSFADLLKEIGNSSELQDFLPYGQTDLDAIFSSSDIDLDDLEVDENFEKDAEEPEEATTPAPKAPKTHAIMRFKVPLGDAEHITKLVAQTQRDHGLNTSDELTNAGDALVHLLGVHFPRSIAAAAAAVSPAALVDGAFILDEIEEAVK